MLRELVSCEMANVRPSPRCEKHDGPTDGRENIENFRRVVTCLFYAVPRTDRMKMQSIKTSARRQALPLPPRITTCSSDRTIRRLFDPSRTINDTEREKR